ncbi:MAG: hypothetical protein HC821_01965 [Lewinella sp.]|nr:hypothetical protein [Lewinella sp.]
MLYREGKLALLTNGLKATDLADTSRFEALSKTRFRVLQSTYFNGQYWYQDDLIRLETTGLAELSALASQLRVVPTFQGQRLLFFQLGSRRSAACLTHEPLMLAQVFSGN